MIFPILFSILSVAVLWMEDLKGLWRLFFLGALASGLFVGLIDLSALLHIALFALIWMAYESGRDQLRFWFLVAFSMLFKLHLFSGFYSGGLTPQLFTNLSPFIAGIFPLAYLKGAPLSGWTDFANMGAVKKPRFHFSGSAAIARTDRRLFLEGLAFSIAGISAIALLGVASGVVSLQVKMPSYAAQRYMMQLLLICPLEEGLYRGFIQKELGSYLKGNRFAALGISTALFMLAHIYWAPSVGLMLFTGVAGLLYGAVYMMTERIESSILCHFMLNIAHMTLFTYHAL